MTVFWPCGKTSPVDRTFSPCRLSGIGGRLKPFYRGGFNDCDREAADIRDRPEPAERLLRRGAGSLDVFASLFLLDRQRAATGSPVHGLARGRLSFHSEIVFVPVS